MTTTRLSSCSLAIQDASACKQYWIDCPYSRRTVPASRQATLGESPWSGMPSKIEPSPTSFHGTILGSGVHGVCEETRSISAITGRCSGASSSRWNAARVYWSGIEA
jgi:hypothetical protein